jgi:AhpD family alkylhydroperoxidase
MSPTSHPEHFAHLRGLMQNLQKHISGPMGGFTQLHRQAMMKGVLDTKIKELIALGISIAIRCDGCITHHVHDALQAEATRDEIMETIGVAVLMGGGPSVIYGAEAL